MAVTTWTRKGVVDLLPKYLTARLEGFLPRADALAAEAGISRTALLGTLQGSFRFGPAPLTLDRYRWRSPYVTKDTWTAGWGELIAAGLGELVDGAWRVTDRGVETAQRQTRELRAYLLTLPLPPPELRRATKALTDLAEELPAWAERARSLRRGILLREEARADVVRLDVAALELGTMRDDTHILAWQRAGYAAPALDALSQVWEGRASVDEVAKALETKQDHESVERSLGELVRRGDLTRDGERLALTPRGKASRDAIERETDRRYFASWPEGDALARLGDDMRALVDSLPR